MGITPETPFWIIYIMLTGAMLLSAFLSVQDHANVALYFKSIQSGVQFPFWHHYDGGHMGCYHPLGRNSAPLAGK